MSAGLCCDKRTEAEPMIGLLVGLSGLAAGDKRYLSGKLAAGTKNNGLKC
jgi:hypothetical protein